MPDLPEALRSLRHRNYRLFCSGQIISLIGTWMQMVALSWLVYRLTGKAAMLGLMTFCNMIPVFLLAPLGGLMADRVPIRRLLLTTQTVAMGLALGLALLTLTHQVRLAHLFLAGLLLGVTNAFDNPARQVFVAETLPRPDLMNAIALNSSMVTGARIAGPALSGVGEGEPLGQGGQIESCRHCLQDCLGGPGKVEVPHPGWPRDKSSSGRLPG